MHLRICTPNDSEALAALFTSSVHSLTADHYNARQRFAWAPVPPDAEEWRHRLRTFETLLAEDQDTAQGFIAFEPGGHIEMLYTATTAARRGVATTLFHGAVARLLAGGEATVLSTEASLVAAPFFARQGFEVTEVQNVVRRGVGFLRYAMSRPII